MVREQLTRRDLLRLSGISLVGFAGCTSSGSPESSPPTGAGEVESLSADHPSQSWVVHLPKPLSNPPTVDPNGESIYVGVGDASLRTPVEDGSDGPFGAMFSLSVADGSKQWGAATAPPVMGRPVVNDRVLHVVTGFSTGFGGEEQRIVAFALNGRKRWETQSPPGTLSIVASAGDTVFAGTRDDAGKLEGERLFGVRSDGEIRWTRDAGSALGAAVVGNTLLYNASDSAIVAYDVMTGSESWQVHQEPIGDQRRWLTTVGERCFTVSSTTREEMGHLTHEVEIVARSAIDGSELWRYAPVSTPGNRFVPTVIADTEPARDDSGGSASIVGADYGGLVFGLDQGGNELWTFSTESDVSDKLAIGGAVYVGDRNGNVYALNPDNGREQWRASMPGLSNVIPVSNGVLAFRIDDGRSILASFRTDGNERWRYTTEKRLTWPTVEGDRAYVGATDGTVFAFEIGD